MTNTPDNTQQLTTLMPRGNLKGLLIMLIAAGLAFGLEAVLPFDANANKGLAILLFVAILWFTEAVHITVTALMVPILAALCAIPKMETKAALSSFADPIIFIFFGGFALATALHMQKLDKKIAMWLISLSKGNMLLAVLLIFLVTAFLSMWISNTATAAMMLPLALGMMDHLDKEKDRHTFAFVLLGIAYSASIGGLGTLVGSPPNMIAAKALSLDFPGWMKLGVPMMLIILPLMVFSLYVVLKPNLKQGSADLHKNQHIPWTPIRIITMILFVCTALAWIFSSKIAEYYPIAKLDTIIALIAAVLVVVLGLATWKDVADNTDWGVLLLFGGGIALSNLLKLSGASAVLGEQMASAFVLAHPFLVVLGVTAFIVILTEFTSNTASAALLVPIFASIATQMGLPKEVLVMVIGIGASCAFMLPVATPPNAIVFGTGLIKQRDMMRVGMLLNALCIVIIAAWAYFFLM
ncbi:SLC13 family permease [Suttonella ornithocola]|uniref:Na(+)/dicarboxylate symporter n=1 Tax=Suttonella ornithocola TaxID=279832 RepID=A0A380MP77_9GAMM|nr:DASS family sodium-coupled anion symporter [Suttonella ornithocola]SUO93984.1 Na(+)/dicarboxylate symporter [Suttonella ornithocola]